jgi:hypothetical protein
MAMFLRRDLMAGPRQSRAAFSPNLAKNARPKGRPSIDDKLTFAPVQRTPLGPSASLAPACRGPLERLQPEPPDGEKDHAHD